MSQKFGWISVDGKFLLQDKGEAGDYFRKNRLIATVLILVPFAILFALRHIVLDLNWNSVQEDFSSFGYTLGIQWAAGVPYMGYHFPMAGQRALAGLLFWLADPLAIDLDRFAALGEALNITVLAAVAWLVADLAAARRMPLWILFAAASLTAAMPSVIRHCAYWSPYMPLGVLLMGAGIASWPALASRFQDRRAASLSFGLLGVAVSVVVTAAIPLAGMALAYLALHRSDRNSPDVGHRRRLHTLILVFSLFVCVLAALGPIHKILYRLSGHFSVAVPLLSGMALPLLFAFDSWRKRAVNLFAAALVQGMVLGLAWAAKQHVGAETLTYPHVIFSAFAATLVTQFLWRTPKTRSLATGPLGWGAIGFVAGANLVSPFIFDVIAVLSTYKAEQQPSRLSSVSQFTTLHLDLPIWDLALPALIVVAVFVLLLRSGRVLWPVACAVLFTALVLMIGMWDVLLVGSTQPHRWGHQERLWMPLLFAAPLALFLLHPLNRLTANAMAVAAVILSAASWWEYATLWSGGAESVQPAIESRLAQTIRQGAAVTGTTRVICLTNLPSSCEAAQIIFSALNGEVGQSARHRLERWQEESRGDGIVYTSGAYAAAHDLAGPAWAVTPNDAASQTALAPFSGSWELVGDQSPLAPYLLWRRK